MTARRTPRAVLRAMSLVSLTAPVAAVLLGASASPSWADGSRGTLSVPGSPVSGVTSVSVKASEPSSLVTDTRGALKVTRPATSSSWTCGVSNGGSCSVTIPTDPGTLPNGEWSATLTDNVGGGVTTKLFYTNFGPTATPADVTAKATNPAPGSTTGTVDLSWSYRGTEPDQWGFHLDDGNGWSADLTTSDAGCDSSGACHYTKQYDNAPGSTQAYSFTVTALRTSGGCATCGSSVAGTASSPATAQLVTPEPPPSPTPAPSGSASPAPGTSPGTTGGSTGGTQASGGKPGSSDAKGPAIIVPTLNPIVARRKTFAQSFNHFSPSLGIPKLPPLPAVTFPETVGGSEGSYQPTLPYKAQPAHTTTNVFSSPLAAVRSLDTEQLAKSLAAALILLVAAAHVRLFLRSQRPE